MSDPATIPVDPPIKITRPHSLEEVLRPLLVALEELAARLEKEKAA
jgi:hypothetical protein